MWSFGMLPVAKRGLSISDSMQFVKNTYEIRTVAPTPASQRTWSLYTEVPAIPFKN